MKAVQLTGIQGLASLQIVDLPPPAVGAGEVLVQVKAAGVNFAELEMIHGRYPAPRALPFTMGFEAAGVVATVGDGVTQLKVGDRVTGIVKSGGYAEYATADASALLPIPAELSFADATTLPVQGISALALLRHAARLQSGDTVLVQAAAGGVGVFLVQLAQLLGAGQVIALVGSSAKAELVRQLGADLVVDYSQPGWSDAVRQATGGRGVDVVLESVSGEVGRESFGLLAPFGRLIIYGARNVADTLAPDQVAQVIHQNQTITGFNIPTLRPEQIHAVVPELLGYVARQQLRLIAGHSFPLAEVHSAYRAMSGRKTTGKVVLVP